MSAAEYRNPLLEQMRALTLPDRKVRTEAESLIAAMGSLVQAEDMLADEISMLWSWLPSFARCKAAHGDRNYHYQPDRWTIVHETLHLFSWLVNSDLERNATDREIFACPCATNFELDIPEGDRCTTPTEDELIALLRQYQTTA